MRRRLSAVREIDMSSDGDAPNNDLLKQATKQLEVFDQPLLTLARSLWPSVSDDKLLIAGVHVAEWLIALILILFIFEVTSFVTKGFLIGLIGVLLAVNGIGTSRLDDAFLIGFVSVCTIVLLGMAKQVQAIESKLGAIEGKLNLPDVEGMLEAVNNKLQRITDLMEQRDLRDTTEH
jgi:hypothetical protein